MKFDPRKQAMVVGGLLVGIATVALGTSAASARDFVGVDLGPVSVGIGAYAPDYYYPPSAAYLAPTATWPSPPVVYQAPPATTYYYDTYATPSYYPAPGTVIIR